VSSADTGLRTHIPFSECAMSSSAKDSENPLSAANAATPAAPLPKSPADSPTRPQPVALEIPVTVNGARTIEGSDKREPFSETTLTVLVFSHGAVIRLATVLAVGQLVFLTNEKSKKEVVCQVIKSKSDGGAGSYVELKFTEPAIGFWGMRFPETRVAPPAAPSSTPRPLAPAASAPPKIVPPALPVAAKSSGPAALPAIQPSAAVPAPGAVKPELPKISGPVNASQPTIIAPLVPPVAASPAVPVVPPPPVEAKPEPSPVTPFIEGFDPELPVNSNEPVVPPPPLSAKPEPPPVPPYIQGFDPELPVNAISHMAPRPVATKTEHHAATPGISEHKPALPAAPASSKISDSTTLSTEELKLQAARLQEQLSSLLFSESAAKPAVVPATSPAPASKQEISSAEAAQKLLDLAAADLKTASAKMKPVPVEPKPAPVKEFKPIPAPPKLAPSSLAVEEVKIPTWLVPLAKNEDIKVTEPAPAENATAAAEELSSDANSTEPSQPVLQDDSSHHAESAIFSGQLLSDPSATLESAESSGSRKSLFLGIAALLIVCVGGFWYSRQPGNALSGLFASKSAASHPAMVVSPASPAPSPEVSSAAPVNSHSVSSPTQPVATSQPVASPSGGNASAPDANSLALAAKNSGAPPHSVPPPVEAPKKAVFGDVHLATPVVSRSGTSQDSNEGEISIGESQPASNGDPLAGLASSHRKEPTAPLPVGGDVKPARLVKSVPPIYPDIARSQHISGDVQIDALIDEAGNVTTTKVLSGPPLLHQAALQALKQWKYEPAQLDGKTTSMHLTVTVQFRAQR
jgi:TonB family protein